MKELSLREIQLVEFEVLKKLKELCEKLNLRYYLYYGTLLGAVRHQGFIPWDDDIDVAMPRPDYEILLRYCTEHAQELAPYRLMNCRTDKQYIYPISRLCDTRYYVDYEGVVQYGLGLFVDIYPLDGCGNTPEEAMATLQMTRNAQTLTALAGSDKFRSSRSGGLLRTLAKFAGYCYVKLRGPQHFAVMADKKAQSVSFEDSKYIACTVWFDSFTWSEKDWLDPADTAVFEGETFPIPADTHGQLQMVYGDYMQLPPAEEQIAHHYYKAYLKDEFAR